MPRPFRPRPLNITVETALEVMMILKGKMCKHVRHHVDDHVDDRRRLRPLGDVQTRGVFISNRI